MDKTMNRATQPTRPRRYPCFLRDGDVKHMAQVEAAYLQMPLEQYLTLAVDYYNRRQQIERERQEEK